jgi:hypothetical protein
MSEEQSVFPCARAYGYRPSRKAKGQLRRLSQRVLDASLAIGAMRDYTFCYQSDPIRLAGCKLLQELAQEITKCGAVLDAIARDVDREGELHLQDWLAQADRLEAIGCSKEFAHGNV